MFNYYQIKGGEEVWRPLPSTRRAQVIEKDDPMFMTVLAVSKLAEDLTHEDKLKLAYAGPYYCDWDSEDESLVIDKVNQFLDSLEGMGVDLDMCRLYATGGRGYHLEIPPEVFMDKIPKNGFVGLPMVYREMSLAMCVDTLDLKIYSAGRGRMWRMQNVQRENGRFKVPVTPAEMREMTPEMSRALSSEKRTVPEPKAPELCINLAVEFSRCAQKVEELLKRRAKFKPDPLLRSKASSASVQYMMAGLGIKPTAGFQDIATQLAIAAVTAGLKEDQFVAECQGLIASHEGDGSRYGSPAKRETELRRMHRYMDGNVCYDFSVGAIKVLMSHSAPDLDGIVTTKADIAEVIKEAAEDAKVLPEGESEVDEYDDVAKGVTISKYGIYLMTEFGQKRICAISFTNSTILKSAETSQIIGYGTDIMVNGVFAGRCTLESDIFSGLVPFNRFASKYGHAFQGSDAHVRTVMMRFVEQAKKKGNVRYVVTREGLDIVSIPLHEDERLREPFMVWADHRGVTVEPRIRETELELHFAGFPDPRGLFRTDIASAPKLVEWLAQDNNKVELEETLRNLMTCQKGDVLAKMIGWYSACYWKQLFQKAYGKFPLLHVNGPAGQGKTELNIAISSLFFYQNESRPMSPGSTAFALQSHLTASSSIPLILDEYKPHEMAKIVHDKLKLMFRDAYNQRDITRGGGSRESDDYRALQFVQLAAPMVFIAEAAEDEAAVMERVVLVTLARPPQSVGLKNLARFQAFRRNRHMLGILGQYMAANIINETTFDSFQAEFDELYAATQYKYMLNEKDLAGDMDSEEMKDKQNAKERSIYNHTVAKFGFQQFRKLVNGALGPVLDELMGELEDGVFSRMSDLHSATTPEYVKVLQEMSSMSYHVDADRPDALRKSHEYNFCTLSGRDCIEIAINPAYQRYRQYTRSGGSSPLFGNWHAFAHGVRDSAAFIKNGTGEALQVPNVYTFDVSELAKLGVDAFK